MVHFNVGFQHFNSFADITLSLAQTLDKMGIPISVEPSTIASQISDNSTTEENHLLEKWMNTAPSDLFQIKWSHYWKPCFLKELKGHLNLELFAINYEFAKNTDDYDYWIYDAVNNLSHKLAVSQYSKNVLIQAGCPSDKVSVMPLGFNPLISQLYFSRSQKNPKDVKYILHMTNSFDLYRFGTDIAIQAFWEEFRNDSKVELVIKDGGKHPDVIVEYLVNIEKQFGKFKSRIRIMPKFCNKAELADLYLSADAFLAPFRGEGFAIKILDAFAAGLPVAMTMYGGPTEYANADNCYPIAYDLIPVGKCYDTQNLNLRNDPHWAEPNVQSVREQLRKIVEDPMRFQVAQKARETANLFNWEAAAQKLLRLMRELF
ncbi:glycosyltransferase family 4 protein [Microcoleus vaginatus]|uniref:glycosyltransferase family 4 protein n=1 Tax=Microcoleus vaginatus TaxID=119532 RepID=UPI001F60A9E4|nr:glycosyltransferase [Microcoleus vaginatus HSN003]